MARHEDEGRGNARQGTRAAQGYSEQGGAWFGQESGGDSGDRSRNQSGGYETVRPGPRGGRDYSSDRTGQFDEGRRGGSGGVAGFLSGGHDQTGNWAGAREDQGRESRNYDDRSSGYGQRRDEGGTAGSRDAPGEYPHQGGLGVTAGPYAHRGEGRYGEQRREQHGDRGGYGGTARPEYRGQEAWSGRGGGERFGEYASSGYGARNQGGYGTEQGRHGGEQHDDRQGRRGEQYDERYGRGGGYGGGPEWRDRHPQQEQFDRERSGFGRYGGGSQGAPGYGGHDRGPASPGGPQRWGQPQEGYSRGAFGSGSSTYGMGSSYAQQGDVAGGASPFGPGSQSGSGGAQARGGGQMQRRGPKNYRRTDQRLQEIISERLVDDPHIDSSEVDVHVKDGEVRLEGTVDDRRTKYLIEELVEGIHGVRDIDNRLKVKRGFLAGLFGGGSDGGDGQRAESRSGATGDDARRGPRDERGESEGWMFRDQRSATEREGAKQEQWQQHSGSTAEALESLQSGTPAPAQPQAAGGPESSGTHVGATHGSPLMAGTADLLGASQSGGGSARPAEPIAPPNAGTTVRNADPTKSATGHGARTGDVGSGTSSGAAESGPVGVDRGSAAKSSGETRPTRRN